MIEAAEELKRESTPAAIEKRRQNEAFWILAERIMKNVREKAYIRSVVKNILNNPR
jgi:hypothetical protein